jgi:hypothetical protein
LVDFLRFLCANVEPLDVRPTATIANALLTVIAQLNVHELFDTLDMRYLEWLAILWSSMVMMCRSAFVVPLLETLFQINGSPNLYHPESFLIPEHVDEAVFSICFGQWLTGFCR